MRAISPSSLGRVYACPASAALPHEPDTSGPAAQYGTQVHALRAFAIAAGEYPHPFDELHAEVKIAHDYRTDRARPITIPGDREYGELGPTEIAGTIDALGVTRDRDNDRAHVTVIDWKTGRRSDHTAQLEWYALAASRLFQTTDAVCRVTYIGKNHPSEFTDSWTMDLSDLARTLARVATVAHRVSMLRKLHVIPHTTPTPGIHCRYCPAKPHCPAQHIESTL